jgi:hypothetical protein
MSRCKACNKELDNPTSRFIEELGCAVEEDLCPYCLELAMAAVVNRDLTDEQEWLRTFGKWEESLREGQNDEAAPR